MKRSMPKPMAKPFEKSPADKEPRGMREGSKREEAFDRKQMAAKKVGRK